MGRKKHPEPLTPAEQRVLEEVRTGATNAEIAVRLGLSINTVKYHVANMLAKTGLTDRSELRNWTMPREGGANWWLRGAVALSGLVGVVSLIAAIAFFVEGESENDRGLWIAYSVRDGIEVREELHGQEHFLEGLGMPLQWSPDGQQLAALGVADGVRNLVLVERGSWERTGIALRAVGLEWSSDGTRIAVATPEGVSILDAAGSLVLSFTQEQSGIPPSLVWSDDGSMLAAARGSAITVVGADGGIRTHDVRVAGDPQGATPIQLWRVEPEGILFSRVPANGPTALQLDPLSGEITETQVTFEQLVQPWSSQLERLANQFPEIRFSGYGVAPTTADGAGTHFVGSSRTTATPADGVIVVVATPRGNHLIEIQPEAEIQVSVVLTGDWAPTGRLAEREAWIAYPTYDRGLTDTIRMVEVQSGEARELRAEDGWLFVTVEWSPDGRWLAAGVARTASDAIELRIYDRDSLDLHATIPDTIAPFWSPDSSRIAAVGDSRLVLASPDGSEIAAGSFGLSGRSGNPAWSPNSRWLAIFTEDQVWTWNRDGNSARLEPMGIDWPTVPIAVQVGWFLGSSELLLVGQLAPAGEAATPVFASLNLDRNELTLLDGFPASGDPLYEFATMTASRPDLSLRPPEMSVEGKGRYYMTYPSNQQPVEDVRLIVVTGAGTYEVAAPGFSGLDRKSFSLVLIGDWPEPPPLAVPTAAPSTIP